MTLVPVDSLLISKYDDRRIRAPTGTGNVKGIDSLCKDDGESGSYDDTIRVNVVSDCFTGV